MLRFGCGEAVCQVSPPRKGQTGLILTWISCDLERQRLRKRSSFIRGKKHSLRTEPLKGEFVSSDTSGVCYPYLFFRHIFEDKEPLYVFGFIKQDEQSGKPLFVSIREFRAKIDRAPDGKIAILDGPLLVCECKEAFFIARLVYSKRRKDYRLSTDTIPFPAGLPPKRRLLSFELLTESKPHALFLGEEGSGGGQEEWTNTLASHFLNKERVLKRLSLQHLSRGGKALAAALTTSNGAWYSVPLLPEKPYENDDLLIDSPLLEDHDAKLQWRGIPGCFASLNSATCLAIDDDEDAMAGFFSSLTSYAASGRYYLGTASKYILEFHHGELVACAPVPHVPVSITLANLFAGEVDAVLVVRYNDPKSTLHILDRNFEVLKEFTEVESVVVGDLLQSGLEQLYISHRTDRPDDERGSQGKEKTKRKRPDTRIQETGGFTLTDQSFTITTHKTTRNNNNKNKKKRGEGEGRSKAKIKRYLLKRTEANAMSLQNVAYSLYSQLMKQQRAQEAVREKLKEKDALINTGCKMLASLNPATRYIWNNTAETGVTLARHLVPLFSSEKEEEEVTLEDLTDMQRECPLSFSAITYSVDSHADVSKLVINFYATNKGERALECVELIVGSLSIHTAAGVSGWHSHCTVSRSEDNSERSGALLLPGEQAAMTASLSLHDLQGQAVNVGLWVEVWVNPEEEYLKYDYSMWPYELPDHSPVEIYFAGALLLDPTHLLFSRSIVPRLDAHAGSLPSELRILVLRLSAPFPRFDPSGSIARLFPITQSNQEETRQVQISTLGSNTVAHSGNGVLLFVDKETSCVFIKAASPSTIAHLLPALINVLPSSVWIMPDASFVLTSVWQFAIALEQELCFIRDWVMEERSQQQQEALADSEGAFSLSATAWRDLQRWYATEQIASELRYYRLSNNVHLLPIRK